MDWSEGSRSSGWTWTDAGLLYRLCAWLSSAKRTIKKKGRQGLSPMEWPGIYSVCYSQLVGNKDSFPLDKIFLAFIGFLYEILKK